MGHPNEAVTRMTNELMQNRKSNDTIGHDDEQRFAKPWEEPLFAADNQAKLNLIAKEDAKIEVECLSKEESWNRQRQRRELRDLANCVSTGTTLSDSFRKSKLQKTLRFFKYPFKVFRSPKMMIPNARLFNGCRTVHSGTPDSVLAPMRNASEKSVSGSIIQFAKDGSTNRDVSAGKGQEHLRSNGMIPARWNDKKEEGFGGDLGNNYLNNYVVAGMEDGVDCDSDSDSD